MSSSDTNTKKQRRVKKNQRGVSLREILIWLLVFSIGIACAVFLNIVFNQRQVPQEAYDGLDYWNTTFGCPYPVTLSSSDLPIVNGINRFDESVPGHITLDTAINGNDATYTVVHSMVHSCKDGEYTLLNPPLMSPMGDFQILGFDGSQYKLLNIRTGQTQYLMDIEEGIAEYFARKDYDINITRPRLYSESYCLVDNLWQGTHQELWDLLLEDDMPTIAHRMLSRMSEDDAVIFLSILFSQIELNGYNCTQLTDYANQQGWR